MTTYSIIQKAQLEGAQRMDAEYFASVHLLKNYYLGSQIANFIQYGTSDDLNEDKVGYPTLRLNEFENYFIKEPDKYCSSVTEKEFNKLELKNGDLLICRTNGNPLLVGKSAIVMEDKPFVFASYLFRVRVDTQKINSATLLAYLHSTPGRSEIEKNMMISNQTNFSPARFRLIRVPKFNRKFQDEIDLLVRNAYKLSKKSKEFYQQAEILLLEELGLKDFQIEDDLSFVINLSDVDSAERIDAEHFQPKFEELVEKIKQNSTQFLTNIIESVGTKFDPGKTPDSEFKYVELANINSSIGIIDGFTEVLGKEAPSRAKRLLKKGDVIVSSIEGSLEKVALVDDMQDGYIASNGFFQFRSKELLPEVILMLAKSIVLRWQFKKHCAGTILTAVPGESLQKMFIPVISKPTQEKIARLVSKSHESKKKSKALLEEAKRKVEKIIEKGGDN